MNISQLVGADAWTTVEGRPYVVYKYAATLDGRIAAADSTSQWPRGLPRAKEGLDFDALLRELSSRGVRGMFREGGPTLAASFVSAGLVDRVIAYIAPALLGRRAPTPSYKSA
jgi:riboflavin biosynthesis pyrimidine reductase